MNDKEVNMEKKDKPLSEWTLKEVQELCDNQDDCPGCPCYTAENGCMFSGEAANWPLDETETIPAPVAKDTTVPDKPAKPRLAEALGVEENETWRYPGLFGLYRIHSGVREYWDNNNGWLSCDCEEDLIKIIAHPESIIRAPRLTEAELAIMRDTGAKYVSRNAAEEGPDCEASVVLWWTKPVKTECGVYANNDGGDTGTLPASLFPSVHPGDCICVEEAGVG